MHLLLHLVPDGLLLLQLLEALLVLVIGHGEAGIDIAPPVVMINATTSSATSFETGGLPNLALGRLGGRSNVRLGHTTAS